LPIDAVASHLLSYDRSVAGVRVVVNGRSINMFSTHLDHQSSTRRLAQVIELKSWAATFPEQRIVAGDFNWYPGTTEINEMTETYKDAWVIAKSKGTATSYAGNPEGYTRNNRIDYVFYSKTASALSVASAQVVDTRASQVSDHRPVVVNFIVN
jgi:endonuclease/exonuclease/phosphatase family metal-dependent hydrolase